MGANGEFSFLNYRPGGQYASILLSNHCGPEVGPEQCSSCRRLKIVGIFYRKRKKLGKNSWLNVSKSGASASTKLGPVTINSRGGLWLNLPGGLNFRGRWK